MTGMRDAKEVDFDPYRSQAQLGVYDALYTEMKDYKAEAEQIYELSELEGALLDVACGTGLHLASLRDDFEVVGMDISPAMLEVARRRLGEGIELIEGDMRDFDLGGRKFGTVTCLFSSIGHMRGMAELERAIACMARHLKQDGVLIVEPWIFPQRWNSSQWKMIDHSADKSVTRVTLAHRFRGEGSNANTGVVGLDMHYFFGPPPHMGYQLVRMNVTMFSQRQYMTAFRKAGLDAHFDPAGLNKMGRGVFVGYKR